MVSSSQDVPKYLLEVMNPDNKLQTISSDSAITCAGGCVLDRPPYQVRLGRSRSWGQEAATGDGRINASTFARLVQKAIWRLSFNSIHGASASLGTALSAGASVQADGDSSPANPPSIVWGWRSPRPTPYKVCGQINRLAAVPDLLGSRAAEASPAAGKYAWKHSRSSGHSEAKAAS